MAKRREKPTRRVPRVRKKVPSIRTRMLFGGVTSPCTLTDHSFRLDYSTDLYACEKCDLTIERVSVELSGLTPNRFAQLFEGVVSRYESRRDRMPLDSDLRRKHEWAERNALTRDGIVCLRCGVGASEMDIASWTDPSVMLNARCADRYYTPDRRLLPARPSSRNCTIHVLRPTDEREFGVAKCIVCGDIVSCSRVDLNAHKNAIKRRKDCLMCGMSLRELERGRRETVGYRSIIKAVAEADFLNDVVPYIGLSTPLIREKKKMPKDDHGPRKRAIRLDED